MPRKRKDITGPDEDLMTGPTHGNDPYFEWLCDIVKGEYYHELFWALDQMTFVSPVKMDDNCVQYVFTLRDNYRGHGYCAGHRDANIEPSVFEVMVSLAVRCENDVMSEMAKGDRTPDWFHEMIYNLGLSHYTDGHFGSAERVATETAIDNWLGRNITRYGKGSAFPLDDRSRRRDCRKAGLWMCMMWYMSENHPAGLYDFEE